MSRTVRNRRDPLSGHGRASHREIGRECLRSWTEVCRDRRYPGPLNIDDFARKPSLPLQGHVYKIQGSSQPRIARSACTGSSHVPPVIVDPKGIPAGRVNSQPVSLCELSATIVDALGLERHAWLNMGYRLSLARRDRRGNRGGPQAGHLSELGGGRD